MRKILLPACVLATALLPLSAMANRADSGFVRIEAGNTDAELEFDGQSASDDDSGYSIRGGYYFSRTWAVEGFYSRYGESKYFDGPDSGTSLELSGFGAGVTGKKNFRDDGLGFYLGGRAGIVASKLDIEVSGVAGITGESDDSVDAYVGVSAGYDFSTNLGLGLSYDWFQARPEIADADVDLTVRTLALGLEYRF